MKSLTILIIIGFIGAITATILAETKQTQNEIVMQTLKKKSDGADTKVIFNHKKHAEDYAKTCDKCHPQLKQKIAAPENDKDTVHAICKSCHDKDQPAKTFACNSCHVK